MQRLFVALDMPKAALDAVCELLDALRPVTKGDGPSRLTGGGRRRDGLERVRWLRRDQLHLTLSFLGDRPLADTETIARVVQSVAGRHARLSLRLGRELGWFPERGRPRVLWLGFEGEAMIEKAAPGSALASLQHDLAHELETELGGLTPTATSTSTFKKPFRPHLTLGRCRQPLRTSEVRTLSDAARKPLDRMGGFQFTLGRMALMRSHLRSTGARYEILASAALDGGGKQPTQGLATGDVSLSYSK